MGRHACNLVSEKSLHTRKLDARSEEKKWGTGYKAGATRITEKIKFRLSTVHLVMEKEVHRGQLTTDFRGLEVCKSLHMQSIKLDFSATLVTFGLRVENFGNLRRL